MEHIITIHNKQHVPYGSVPYVFSAFCSCRTLSISNGWNAWNWVALAIQNHFIHVGMANNKGLIHDEPH